MRNALLIFFCIPTWFYGLVLEDEVRKDLEKIGIYPCLHQEVEPLDIAIIGSGQAGMSLYLGLQKEGINHIAIFDAGKEDLEGPWLTTARMMALRSHKEDLYSFALDVPSLTFCSWYQAQYGNWDCMEKVLTPIWAEYLQWYKRVLHLNVHNEYRLETIEPVDDLFHLYFHNGKRVITKKIVLATGRGGSGGLEFPSWVTSLPRESYFHTGEYIDHAWLKNKRVTIIGAGASAFDAAAVSLESGAARVDMLMRKPALVEDFLPSPCENWEDYYFLSDQVKADYFVKDLMNGDPPPEHSKNRIANFTNFTLHPKTELIKARRTRNIVLQTNQGTIRSDILILATGYRANLFAVPYLKSIAEHILLWGDQLPGISSKLSCFPYIGDHFQFLEKRRGEAPYLKNIYCFNFGAFLTQGHIAGDISRLSIGVERLAKGIKKDLGL